MIEKALALAFRRERAAYGAVLEGNSPEVLLTAETGYHAVVPSVGRIGERTVLRPVALATARLTGKALAEAETTALRGRLRQWLEGLGA